MKRIASLLFSIMVTLMVAFSLQPEAAKANVVFEDMPTFVVPDMYTFDQNCGLSWELKWNLDKNTEVKEQVRYGKFVIAQKSIVRIKMNITDRKAFATKDYFRLYANEAMTSSLTDNGIDFDGGDDWFILEPGTYYVACGSGLYMEGTSAHTTKIMIGTIPYDSATTVEQSVNADRTEVTLKVNTKITNDYTTVRWDENQMNRVSSIAPKVNADGTFKVTKNGWYTVMVTGDSTVGFNKEITQFIYVEVKGIGPGAKKGVTYTVDGLKYKLVKAGFDGKGTVMVTGIERQAPKVTIPKKVHIDGQDYSIVKINKKAFFKMNQIKNIVIKSDTIKSIGKNAFKGIDAKAKFKVPKKLKKQYKKMLSAKTGFVKKTMKIK